MIELIDVTKRFGGITAIDRVNLTIPETGIYCLLGRNGAGKTTFMKLLAGHIAATDGEIKMEDKRVSPGHMPDSISFIESGSVQFNFRVSQLIEAAA